MRYEGKLDTLPWPYVYTFPIPMPQEDGTWWWEASSITMHFIEMSLTLRSNNLTLIGLLRFASLDDYLASIVAEFFPQMFGYTGAELNYTKGIPTRPGSVYAILGYFASASLTEEISMVCNGLITDLTREWMLT